VSAYILGIDLGTVNSCVAAVIDSRPTVLRDEANVTIPSCLAITRGKELVGRAARRQAVMDPKSTVWAVKRLMGHAWDSPEVQSARQRVTYPIKPSPLGGVLIEIAGRDLTPVQVSARVLQKIREVAEAALGESVEKAVISVPAHFTDVQRKATKLAAEYAGLKALRLINEPTAAAFAYGYRKGEDFTLAVYDLGGGTFDITVLTARGNVFEVEATDGDSYLGGEDFDHVITQWLDAESRAEFGESLQLDESARMRLKDAAERAKVELSEAGEATIELPYLTQLPDGSRPTFRRVLTRAKLEELTRPIIERTLEICGRCLREAGLRPDDVQEVLLVGGQTRMPLVREVVGGFFGRDARRDINPDEVVALGAALYGYSLEADNLLVEAENEAEEAYAVALKEAGIARKIVQRVEQLQTKAPNSGALATRLEELLREAEAELPTLVDRGRADENLPERVRELQSEIAELQQEANAAMESVKAKLETTVTKVDGGDAEAETLLGKAAERITQRLASAQEASSRAEVHHGQAEQHRTARRVDLIDVTSHALGIGTAGDLFSILIDKNKPVPVEEERIFTTMQDGQVEVEIRVAQGSAQRASENQFLGSFTLQGIQPAPRMEPKILVRFRIDEDGILSVTARDAVTRVEQGIRVEDPLGLQQRSAGEA
jgi:molecular chaperone DnaK (HSP70)